LEVGQEVAHQLGVKVGDVELLGGLRVRYWANCNSKRQASL